VAEQVRSNLEVTLHGGDDFMLANLFHKLGSKLQAPGEVGELLEP